MGPVEDKKQENISKGKIREAQQQQKFDGCESKYPFEKPYFFDFN